MRSLPVAALLLLMALPLRAATAESEIAFGPDLTVTSTFPQERLGFPGGVSVQPNIEFARPLGYRPLLLDLYRTTSDKIPRPLVVYVHGGNWNSGDSRVAGAFLDFPDVLARLARRGYVVASINYRLMAEAHFPAPVEDVNTAIAFLRAHAAEYGIDPRRVVLWGGSAGGHLAALAAASCGEAVAESAAAVPANPPCVQGVVIWYGIFDLRPLVALGEKFAEQKRLVASFLGCSSLEACPDKVAQSSPITHISKSIPPLLLIHGSDDTMVPVQQTQMMAGRLRQDGAPVETDIIAHVGHGFVGASLEATREAGLRALHLSFDFIDRIAYPKKVAADRPSVVRTATETPLP